MPISTNHDSTSYSSSPSQPAFPSLEHFRIKNIPPAAYYIPDFITEEEEAYLTRKIKASPQPKWKTVGTGRRIQYWGGNMSKNGVLLPEPLPDFLTTFPDIIERIESFLDIANGKPESDRSTLGINQVLVNEYQPHHSISPHEDGPAFRPLVATISLGSHTILDLHHYISPTSPSPPMTSSHIPSDSTAATSDGHEERIIAAVPLAHILLLPRSLFILSSSLYTSHLHGITGRVVDDLASLTPTGGGRDPNKDPEVEDKPQDTGRRSIGQAVIANAELVGDATTLDALRDGSWRAERGERVSLTFRHANKVVKGGALGLAAAALKR